METLTTTMMARAALKVPTASLVMVMGDQRDEGEGIRADGEESFAWTDQRVAVLQEEGSVAKVRRKEYDRL